MAFDVTGECLSRHVHAGHGGHCGWFAPTANVWWSSHPWSCWVQLFDHRTPPVVATDARCPGVDDSDPLVHPRGARAEV